MKKKAKITLLVFVRWTEQRNFEAVLEMMSSGILDVKPLITHHYEIIAAAAAYQLLDDPKSYGDSFTIS